MADNKKKKAKAADDLFLEEWDVKPKRKRAKPRPKAAAKARATATKPKSKATATKPKAKAAAKARPAAKKRPAKKPAKKRAKRGEAALAANLLLSVGIAAMLALGGMLIYKHNSYAEMKQVVEAQTFYDGTSVEGIDLSGKTLSAAMDYWQNRIEPRYSQRTVDVAGAGSVTASDVGYKSDYESVLYTAWSAGRRGSLEERYQAAVGRQYHPLSYDVTRFGWDDKTLSAYVSALAEKVDAPAQNASIQSFDVENYAFVLSESSTGRKLDEAGLKQDIIDALKAGGGSVTPVVETLQPEVTQDDVNAQFGMISSAVTNASSSSSNRLKNIKLAVSMINGYCLKNGETFSFNDVVGERTTARGFKRATAYSGGDVTEEVGGGICQVSTTLFNAAVKADMDIVERHNHSLTVAYVDKGKDAAVNWKSQDLKFTNKSGGDVYICCFVSDDKRVRFAFFGRFLPNGETITLEGKTTETVDYETEYVPSATLARGEMKVVDQGKKGYKAEAYKFRWDAAGNQISKELLCKSVYKSRNEVIEFGG